MQTAERQHYWDVTRAALMLLGIPYHVAMLYHPGGWIVDVNMPSPLLGGLAAAIHAFRMPAFFVVAGYFAAMLLERRNPGEWLRGRGLRLGVPLLTSLIVLVPVLNILGELSARPAGAAFQEWRYQTSTSGGYWVRHLWFLIVLLYLSGAAAALSAWERSRDSSSQPAKKKAANGTVQSGFWPSSRWRTAPAAMPLVLLALACAIGLFEAVSIELFYKAGLNTNLLQQILRIDDLLTAAPYFAFGAFVQRKPALTAAFVRPSIPVIAVGAIALAVVIGWGEAMWPPAGRFVCTIAAIAATQALVSLARTFLDRPNPTVRRLVDGSFVIYLFHLPILIGLYDLARLWSLPPAIGFPLILASTMGLSWFVWRLVERSTALNFLFNGIVPDARVAGSRPHVAGQRPAPSL